MSETPTTWPSRVPLLAMALVMATLCVRPWPFVATVPLAVLLVVLLTRIRSSATDARGVRWETWLAIAAMAVPTLAAQILMPSNSAYPFIALILGVAAIATAVEAVLLPRLLWLHLVVVGGLHLFYVRTFDPVIDVKQMVSGSASALLDGRHPYTLTFPNPYDAAQTARFWAPEFIDGDRITIGFPYLPGSLLGYLPGYLLGELRLVSIAALLLITALVWRLASDIVGRLLAVGLPLTSLSLATTSTYWVEPIVLLAVALLAWSSRHHARATGVAAVALLLASKQYAVVWLPLERLVRRLLGVRVLLAGVAVAFVVVMSAFVSAPAGFWQAVVRAHIMQPYRSESISLAVDLVDAGLPAPSIVLSVASLVGGLAVATWVRAKAPETTTWLVLGIGLSLLTTVLLSKQAFTNYYFLIHGCLVIAVVLWPGDLGEVNDHPALGATTADDEGRDHGRTAGRGLRAGPADAPRGAPATG